MGNSDWPSLSVWDQAQLYQRLNNNNRIIIRLLRLCSSDLPPHLAALQTSLKAKDLKEVNQLAHTIKGIAANVCAQELAQLAAEIEIFAQVQGQEVVEYLWPNFEQQHQNFQQRISQHLSGLEKEQNQELIVDRDSALQTLNGLVVKLKAGDYVDSHELNVISGLLSSEQAEQLSELLAEINSAVAHFDSQLAVEKLANLAFVAKLEIAI